jgi:tryptophan-rich sensory protein
MQGKAIERYTTAVIVIGCIIMTYFFSRPRKRGLDTELEQDQQEELDQNLTAPANETFGVVWPVIYTGITGLAVHQALPAHYQNQRYHQAQSWFRVSFALNALFGYFFSRPGLSRRVGSSLTTISLLVTAVKLHQKLRIGQTPVSQPERALRTSVGLYAGWLTAASVVSVGNLLLQSGFRVRPAMAIRLAWVILSGTAGLGIVVSRRLNDPYYLFTLVAAFIGVAFKQAGKNDSVARLAGACALLLSGVIVQRLRTELTVRPAQESPALPDSDSAMDDAMAKREKVTKERA